MTDAPKAGRPTSLTPDLQKKIVKLLADGNTVKDTCAAVDLDKATFYRWMRRGRDGDPDFCDFCDSVMRARAKANTVAVEALRSALKRQKTITTISETFTETRLKRDGTEYEYTSTTERTTTTTAPPDWRAAESYLKRRDPKHWSEKVAMEHTGRDGNPIQTESKIDLSGLSLDQLRALAASLSES